jgi:hypothetical protein
MEAALVMPRSLDLCRRRARQSATPHPGVAFLFRRQDHRHGFRMDLLNDRVRRRRRRLSAI